MTTQPIQQLTDLKLTDEIKAAVNGAFEAGKPIVLAYVAEDGQPSLSFRGSTQAYSDDQLAVWVRNPDGGLIKSLAKNPRISLMYRDRDTRTNLQFRGRGHLENAEDIRKKVYESSPEAEQRSDAERKGMPLIIDLDRVDGTMPPYQVVMRRK